jgi:hypothetical protein
MNPVLDANLPRLEHDSKGLIKLVILTGENLDVTKYVAFNFVAQNVRVITQPSEVSPKRLIVPFPHLVVDETDGILKGAAVGTVRLSILYKDEQQKEASTDYTQLLGPGDVGGTINGGNGKGKQPKVLVPQQ